MHRRLDFFYPPQAPPPLLKAETTVGAYNNGGLSSSSSSSSKDFKPSILIISIIFTAVLIVSISLHLLLRYLNSHCRNSSSGDDGDEPTDEPHRDHRFPSGRVSPVDQTLIDSLPVFSFNSITGLRHSSAADCAVCLSKFEPHDQLRLLPICCHAFHARCIDTWLVSNQTCPLCRSTVHVAESEGSLKLSTSSAGRDSFRLEIGSVSRRMLESDSGEARRSYSMGSFDYVVEQESEVVVGPTDRRGVSESSIRGNDKDDFESPVNATPPEPPGSEVAAEVAGGRSWLKDCADRMASSASSSFSSRALSVRFSGRVFTGSSRRSSRRSDGGAADVGGGSWDLEGNVVADEISNFFRWLTGV